MQTTIERLRAEFIEMPGLRLTIPQVRRLCGIDETQCRAALEALVDSRFLCKRMDGTYARASEGPAVRPRVLKADLPSLSRAAGRTASH